MRKAVWCNRCGKKGRGATKSKVAQVFFIIFILFVLLRRKKEILFFERQRGWGVPVTHVWVAAGCSLPSFFAFPNVSSFVCVPGF